MAKKGNKKEFDLLRKKVLSLRKMLQPNRVMILMLLLERETCACELVEMLDMPNNLVSHHLGVLKDLGYLKKRTVGLHRKYSIREEKMKEVKRLLGCLQEGLML